MQALTHSLPIPPRPALQALKEGKRLLKEQNAGAAVVRFEKALLLAKCVGDKASLLGPAGAGLWLRVCLGLAWAGVAGWGWAEVGWAGMWQE